MYIFLLIHFILLSHVKMIFFYDFVFKDHMYVGCPCIFLLNFFSFSSFQIINEKIRSQEEIKSEKIKSFITQDYKHFHHKGPICPYNNNYHK
jgi:hypothetical protein